MDTTKLLRAGTSLNRNTHDAILLGAPEHLLRAKNTGWQVDMESRETDDDLGHISVGSEEDGRALARRLNSGDSNVRATVSRQGEPGDVELVGDLTTATFAATYQKNVLAQSRRSVNEWNARLNDQLRPFNVGVGIVVLGV